MIRKLKIRLIILTMTSVLLLLTGLVAGMNIINYTSLTHESDRVLNELAEMYVSFPSDLKKPIGFPIRPGTPLPNMPFTDVSSETRYFSVWMDTDGNVLRTDISQIGSVSEETAAAFANEVYTQGNAHGFLGSFRYLTVKANDFVSGSALQVIFLDVGHRLDSFYTFAKVSTASAVIGFLVVLMIFCLVSSYLIHPIAESYAKQRRFITDAGHELKTPLTIINANVDILEMELDTANESIDDIRLQTKRLTALTNDLVYLARMEETDQSVPMVEFPIAETVRETAEPFRAPAIAEGKIWQCDIPPMLTAKGDDKSIRQLVSILLDNALKYSPKQGTVTLRLYAQGHSVVLSVCNTCHSEISQNELDRVFDRFYRIDPSRNSDTGGHGIGLSIAKAIVHAHGGKITASVENGNTFCMTVTLPM